MQSPLPMIGLKSRALRGRFRFVHLTFLFLGVLACGSESTTKPPPGNRAPSIRSLEVVPARVHARERVRAVVAATDPDGDRLLYTWTASRGAFPEGYRSPSVVWETPDTRGIDTLWVEIGDLKTSVRQSLVVSEVVVAPPGEIRALAGSSYLRLSWEPSIDEKVAGFVGYEVFQATRSFDEIPPESIYDYRITQPPVDQASLTVTHLQSGVRYWFKVLAIRYFAEPPPPWDERSHLTTETSAAPRPEGKVDLKELLNPSGATALDLSGPGTVRAFDPRHPDDIGLFDLYLGTEDSLDAGGALVLKSVSLLHRLDPAWASREVWIKPLGTDWLVDTTSDDEWEDHALVEVGRVYAVKTPEGNYAKIEVLEGNTGSHPYRQIPLQWAFQLIPDYPSF